MIERFFLCLFSSHTQAHSPAHTRARIPRLHTQHHTPRGRQKRVLCPVRAFCVLDSPASLAKPPQRSLDLEKYFRHYSHLLGSNLAAYTQTHLPSGLHSSPTNLHVRNSVRVSCHRLDTVLRPQGERHMLGASVAGQGPSGKGRPTVPPLDSFRKEAIPPWSASCLARFARAGSRSCLPR